MVEITQYALYLFLRSVTVGSARAVGELLDLLGVHPYRSKHIVVFK